MPIIVECPSCAASYQLAEEQAGKKGRCSRCGNLFKIPKGSAAESVDANSYELADETPETIGGSARDSRAGSSTFVPARARSEPEHMPERLAFSHLHDRAVQTTHETRALDLAILLGLATVGFVLILGLGYLCFFVPGGTYPAGMVLWMIGTCFIIYGYWYGSHMAFDESFARGLLFRLFFPYTLYFLISRGSETRRELCYVLVGFVLWLTGSIAMQYVFVQSLKEVGVRAEDFRQGR